MNKPPEDTKTGLEPIAKRVPIERTIDLRFTNFEGLVTGVSANLSTSGMFIQSNSPESAGTEFDFALRIEEWSPIQGTAKVIWIRPHTESPERPAGMGVQFVDLDAQSRRMIRWLVDKHVQEGGTVFDLETVPAGASKYGASGAKKKTKGPGKRIRRPMGDQSPGSKWVLWALSLIIVGAIAVGVYLTWFDNRAGVGPLRPPFRAGTDNQPGDLDAEIANQDAESDPDVADPGAEVTIDAITGFVRSWTDAWEARDVDGVLSHYSEDFDASAWGGRQQWESEIRQLIDGSEHIRVAVSALEVSFSAANAARAEFFQSFRSDSRDESGRLLLELEPTASGWKIRREQSVD